MPVTVDVAQNSGELEVFIQLIGWLLLSYIQFNINFYVVQRNYIFV